jgi:hypothetical protein
LPVIIKQPHLSITYLKNAGTGGAGVVEFILTMNKAWVLPHTPSPPAKKKKKKERERKKRK